MKRLLSVIGISIALCACTQQTTSGSQTSSPDNSAPVAGKRAAMEWTAVQTGTGSTGQPQTALVLKVPSTGQELYRTTCTGVATTDVQDMGDSVASVQCWWAGGGEQYGVFIGDAEKMTIRHRTVDEEAGFGQWEDVK